MESHVVWSGSSWRDQPPPVEKPLRAPRTDHPKGLQGLIVQQLTSQPMTVRDLRSKTGAPISSVKSAVAELRQKRVIVTVGRRKETSGGGQYAAIYGLRK